MNVDMVELRDFRVLAFRRVGPYGPGVAEAFCKLVSFSCERNLFNGSSLVLGAYWDCPKTCPNDQLRMDACLTLNPDSNPPLAEGFRIETLPGGLFASYLCSVYGDDFKTRYEELFSYMKGKGGEYRVPNPNYEFYYGPCPKEHPMKKWVVDILFPVKSRF